MTELPTVGTRVSLRYRLPRGSTPPHTDVVGHLVQLVPTLRVRTRRGGVVDIAPGDVLAVRVVPEIPVRTGEIRNLEHAAALGWPGIEQHWQEGWLFRYGLGNTRRANSAVPLRFTSYAELSAAVDWYAARHLPALISAPDRLFRLPAGVPVQAETLVMAGDLDCAVSAAEMTLTGRPSEVWRQVNTREIPEQVLTAVVDGQVMFGELGGLAVGRVAMTDSPDGTRWAGLSAVHVREHARGRGLARTVCSGLLNWAREAGATRGYVQVLAANAAARALYESMGFGVHHRSRYVHANDLLNGLLS
ncbi:MAG: GNAT family N-acetyltransferase [Mycolicibacterium sp.]|uniref:N-acetylglutamate synthase, CG3035 family n=1 Tax=Mycolicibacterium sp. TaxID=2320850 RepID=UPI003D09A698